MNKQSNSYTVLYATVIVVIVAIALTFAAIQLKPRQDRNIEVEKMSAILTTIGQSDGIATAKDKDAYIRDQYKRYITGSYMVDSTGAKVEGDAFASLGDLPAVFADGNNAFPVFEATMDNGEKLFVVPMTGKGLWGPVWGYLAMDNDGNTIRGAVFDHKGETPGLGAEIATPVFGSQFISKTIFDGREFVSIDLTKGRGSSAGNDHAVDAISGGTLTSNGVKAMLFDCLDKYVGFFDSLRAQEPVMVEGEAADSIQNPTVETVE